VDHGLKSAGKKSRGEDHYVGNDYVATATVKGRNTIQ
jgi:hypothetical protein